jgi:putative tricarboxylic transport membrane protein
MFDIGVMFISGGVGYLLYRASYPFAPLILGLILGPLADQTLRRTIWIYDGKYHELLTRPVGLVLLVAVVWSFYYGIRRSLDESSKIKAQADKSADARAGSKQRA